MAVPGARWPFMRSSVVFTSVTPGHAGILDHRFAAAAVPTLKAFRTLLPDAPATEQVGRAIARQDVLVRLE